MKKLAQLKQYATEELGLSREQIKRFGALNKRSTWEQAIAAAQDSQLQLNLSQDKSANKQPPADQLKTGQLKNRVIGQNSEIQDSDIKSATPQVFESKLGLDLDPIPDQTSTLSRGSSQKPSQRPSQRPSQKPDQQLDQDLADSLVQGTDQASIQTDPRTPPQRLPTFPGIISGTNSRANSGTKSQPARTVAAKISLGSVQTSLQVLEREPPRYAPNLSCEKWSIPC
ncbi:MAG: hypothetical protein HC920_08240 [Oscillatoriales cyanobacterium SM2_3_0]|nr:hypothetical protein [Oscillatoriales cyanobacterium SM2_3_0]